MLKITLLFLCCISATCLSQQFQIVSEEIPPLQMLDNNNQPSGAMVEIVQAMLKKAQLSSEIKFYPWARSYQLALSKKNTIIFSLFRDKKREKKFQWIGKLYTLKSYLATLKSKPEININSLTDAKKYSIGTIRSDLAESYLREHSFKNNDNLIISSKYDVLWELLYSGRIDAAFTNDKVWRYEIAAIGLDPNEIKLNYQVPNFANDLYIAASLQTDASIVHALKNALSEMKKDGSYQKILKQWQM